ncbi:hypothetical protein Golob_021606, partial [Gossypium lobatum]|nr:hypothetical protein [Gossypium lobatum]
MEKELCIPLLGFLMMIFWFGMQRLLNRKLRLDAVCPCCSVAAETLEYIFCNCISVSVIWSDLNLYVHEGAIIQTHIIIHKVKTYLLELDTVHAKIPGRQIGVERWQPLNVDSLKINFDETYCANTRTSCSRIVIWNCLGCVIGSSMVINRNFPSAFAVKAIAYSQAILLSLDLGIPNVIVEGDALTMIWRVLSPAPDNLVLDAYIRDIKCQG